MSENVVHVYFLLDKSGSMSGVSIDMLNEAMARTIPELKRAAASLGNVTAVVHVLAFNGYVEWLGGTSAVNGIPADDFVWRDIDSGGNTNTEEAIRAILPGMTTALLGHKSFRPVVVLITDGVSDSDHKPFAAIEELKARQKTINVAIGVDGYDASELESFASVGLVSTVDGFGEYVSEPVKQKLIFPVSDSNRLGGVIMNVAESSLISSTKYNGENDLPRIELKETAEPTQFNWA